MRSHALYRCAVVAVLTLATAVPAAAHEASAAHEAPFASRGDTTAFPG